MDNKNLAENSNFICTTKGVYFKKIDKDTGEIDTQYICRSIYIKQIIRMLDTNDMYWKVCFYCNDGWQEEVIAREDITESRITSLIRKGADVGGSKTKIILDYLFSIERDAHCIFQFKYLGWQTVNNKLIFAHSKLLLDEGERPSIYSGQYNVFKKGSYKFWRDALLKHLADNYELQLALCFGFSAVINGYINQILRVHADSLLFHISGNSTTGKTSAAIVAVSGFGDPKEGGKSLIQSFNGTDNALTNMLSNNNGIPIVCDETSISQMPTQKLVNVLYTWAKNIEKARLNKTSEMRDRNEWATSIITTGEGSLIDSINQNEGIRARLFEFRNIQWTKSAKQSEELVRILSNNYGHGVEPFVKAINSMSKSSFDTMWQTETRLMMEKMPTSKFNNRIGKKFAILVMTAKLLNKVFDFNLDIDKITEILLAQELESVEERNIGNKVQEDLIEWLTSNKSKFYIKKKNDPSNEAWGRIEIKMGETTAYILPQKFKSFLRSYAYSDRLVVLRELQNLDMIISEKNKYVTRRVVRGLSGGKNGVQVYAIKFDRLFMGALEDENLSEPKPKPKPKPQLKPKLKPKPKRTPIQKKALDNLLDHDNDDDDEI